MAYWGALTTIMTKPRKECADWNGWWPEKFEELKLLYRVWHHFLWRAYERLLSNVPLKPESRVLELGCGSGHISLLLAKKYGCAVTLADSSEYAIALASRLFESQGVSARFIQSDLLALTLPEEFDLVHNEGVIEHFHPGELTHVMLAHRNLTRPGGHVIIFVPTDSICYRVSSWVMKASNNWYFGDETPLSLRQLTGLYKEVGLEQIGHTSVLGREIGLVGQRTKDISADGGLMHSFKAGCAR